MVFWKRATCCIAFNARGYPPSDVPEEADQYSQSLAVEDIANVMRHCGAGKAHVVGCSMGGYATLNFAIAYPEMVRSITAVGAGHGSDPDKREVFLRDSAALADKLLSEGMRDGIGDYMNGPNRRRFKEKDPRGFDEFKRRAGEHSAVGSALTMRGCQLRRPTVYDLEPKLRELKVPALIVTGDDDDPCLAPSLFLKRTIPDARLWVVPRTTHTVNLEEPAGFNRVLMDFLSGTDARTP